LQITGEDVHKQGNTQNAANAFVPLHGRHPRIIDSRRSLVGLAAWEPKYKTLEAQACSCTKSDRQQIPRVDTVLNSTNLASPYITCNLNIYQVYKLRDNV
jgi:hypothetical protein